jgi:hypothetical protein
LTAIAGLGFDAQHALQRDNSVLRIELLTPAAILHLHLNERGGMDRPAVSRTPCAPSLQEANDEKNPNRFRYSARDRGARMRAQTAGAWRKRQLTH